MSLAKHVIHQPKPYRTFIIVLISVMITATSVGFYFYNQQQQQLQQLSDLQLENSLLSQQLLTKEQTLHTTTQYKQQLNTSNMELISDLAIQRVSSEQLQLQLSQLQQQTMELNKELLFYQTITQGNSSSKLQIRELDLFSSAQDPQLIRYRIVISQGKKMSKPMKGKIEIKLSSEQQEKPNRILVAQHDLNLRYVQVVEGQIKLADNTRPGNIIINVTPTKKATLSRTFDWKLSTQQ